MKSHILAIFAASIATVSAANYTIDWMDMSATPLTGGVSNPSPVYNLPGYGNVQVTYTSTTLNWTRQQGALQQNGSFVAGGDQYSWTTKDGMDAVNFDANGTAQNYLITFTLQNGPIPAGQLVLGTAGLGHSSAAGFTRVRVLQNGTFLNDWDLGANFGPTAFTPGVGNFELTNSLTEPTNGYFNTDVGVTRIDDSVTSLQLIVHHIGQDGIGFNIGRISPVPEPAAAGLAAAGLTILLRRRRSVG